MTDSATFPGGFTLAPATQGEIDYVEANYREGDRREQEMEGGGRTMLDEFERCWTVRAANSDIVGYFGVMAPRDASFMSRTRMFCFMSCANANRHKFAFVKASRPVFRWVAERCPPWTDTFRACPLESYRESVRWQRRTLGMRQVGRVPAGSSDFYAIMEITRQEVEQWE